MDKVKFFNQQLNGQIVMAELEAEHLAKSIRLLSEGDDYVAWAGEVANYATTLNQLAEVLTALRKVARDSEILMEREEKALVQKRFTRPWRPSSMPWTAPKKRP